MTLSRYSPTQMSKNTPKAFVPGKGENDFGNKYFYNDDNGGKE